MRFEVKMITSLSNFVASAAKHSSRIKQPIWWRGHTKTSYVLQPRAYRPNETIHKESLYIALFKQNATLLLPETQRDSFDWLFLMQHYGLPTRLLDWTESPLVALYFALKSTYNGNSVVWGLLPKELNTLASVKYDDPFQLPVFSEHDGHMKNYSTSSYEADNMSDLQPLAGIATRNNTRMQAQLGMFTIHHNNTTPIERIKGIGDYVWQYIIRGDVRLRMLKHLSGLGFNEFRLFPEVDKIANYLHG